MNVVAAKYKASGTNSVNLGCHKPSPDGTLLAYTLDTTGYETYSTYFKDLRTGEMVAEELPENSGRVSWGADTRTVYYVTQDKAHRPHKLWRHVMGTAKETDECLHTEEDELYWMGFGKTTSGRYLVLSLGSKETSELHFIDLE